MSKDPLLSYPIGGVVTMNKVMSMATGSAIDPAVTFVDDPTTGWYLDDKGNMVFTAGGADNIVHNANYTEIKTCMLLNETDSLLLDDKDNRGILFKKTNDDGLWWKTRNGEINIVSGAFIAPRVTFAVNDKTSIESSISSSNLPNGDAINPSLSFNSDTSTGVYLSSIGNLSFTSLGDESLRINNTLIKIFKPMEIVDNICTESPSTEFSGFLYKKPSDNGLWWKTQNNEVNITKLPDILQQLDGSIDMPQYSFANDPSTGIYLISPNNLGITVGGNLKVEFKQNELSSKVPIKLNNGNILAPSLAFNNSSNTGLYTSEPGKINIVTNASSVLEIDSNNLSSNVPINLSDGSINKPSIRFNNDKETGIFRSDAGALSVAARNVEIIRFNNVVESKVPIVSIDGTVVNPGFTFDSNRTTGLYYDKDQQNLGMSISGIELFKANNSSLRMNKPILVMDSNTPQYSFVSDNLSGLYYKNASVGLSCKDTLLDINTNRIAINKPLELNDISDGLSSSGSQSSSGSHGSSGKLYKKTNSNGLWWSVDGIEIDLSKKPDTIIQQVLPETSSPILSTLSSDELKNLRDRLDVIETKPLSSDELKNLRDRLDVIENDQKKISTIDGKLYKKPDSNGLWWSVAGMEYNLMDHSFIDSRLDALNNKIKDVVSFAVDKKVEVIDRELSNKLDASVDTIIKTYLEDSVVKSVSSGLDTLAASFYKTLLQSEDKLVSNINSKIDIISKEFPLVAPEGISYSFGKETGLCYYDDTMSFIINGNTVLSSSNTATKICGDLLLDGGKLQSVGSELHWVGLDDRTINLTKPEYEMKFPINAPIGNEKEPSYGFINSKSGMYLGNSLCFSYDGKSVMELNNNVSVSNGTEDLPTYGFTGINKVGVYYNDNYNIVVGETKLSIGNKITTKVQVKSSVTNDIGFGFDNNSGQEAGIIKLDETTVALKSFDKSNSIVMDSNNVTINKPIVLANIDDSGKLYKKSNDANLYWKVDNADIQITCDNLTYKAADNISAGDVVCLDPAGSGQLFKAIGGQWFKPPTQKIPYSGISRCSLVKPHTMENSILVNTGTIDSCNNTQLIANFCLFNKNNLSLVSSSLLILDTIDKDVDLATDIIELNNKRYCIAWMHPDDTNIHMSVITINDDFSLTKEKENITIDMTHICENFTMTVDQTSNIIIIAAYSSVISNFIVALLDANNLNIGTIDTSISIEPIIDSVKQIRILSIPGQIAVISYGNRKTAIALTTYDGAIASGETLMDYEGYDCADMIYDNMYGVIISVEQTNAVTCYIQILDVLGTKIQRVVSKKFSSTINMKPMSIDITSNGNYLLLYANATTNGNMFCQFIYFDGELLSFGLSYNAGDDVNIGQIPPAPLRGKSLFALNNGKFLALWSIGKNGRQMNLALFTDGYNGYPSSFIGLARNNALPGNMCCITVKGFIHKGSLLPNEFLGKKLYLNNLSATYPNNLSTNSLGGVFIGTCLDNCRIIVGL